ncbi:hypothetical protein [Bacillus tropicus]|uniref:hypothetical protein n=1 Tax=Bacillus tropicus TaxID=2026188 RepID=UPI0037F61296
MPTTRTLLPLKFKRTSLAESGNWTVRVIVTAIRCGMGSEKKITEELGMDILFT